MSLTIDLYTKLSLAYSHFNEELFGGSLPDCVITLAHHRGAYGYFRDRPFSSREPGDDVVVDEDGNEKGLVDEIALNPWKFRGRTDREIFSTLVHEMVHLQQHHFGKPPKRPTHNKEWAEMMKVVGLHPSSTGEPEGKETGRRVSHYIIEGGPYAESYERLEISIDWAALERTKKKKQREPKITYACEACEVKVRGKSGFNIVCGDCGEEMTHG